MKKYLRVTALACFALFVVGGCGERSASSSSDENVSSPAKKPVEHVTEATPSKEAKAIEENGANGIYTILILHNGEDTAKLHGTLVSLAKGIDKCACLIVRADDAGLATLFKKLRLDAETIPTPMAFAIAPNMLITGTFMQPPTETAFREAILPEQPLAIRKALMNGKNVIVKIQSSRTIGNKETDKAIEEYLSDPKTKDMYVSIPVTLDSAENALFLKQLKIDPTKETKSIIIGMAPPLKIVNTPFRGAAKKIDVEKAVNPACDTGCGPGG